MSTKKRLLEVVKKISDIDKAERTAFSQINAYEIAQNLPKLTNELSKIYEELTRKQHTSITKHLLLKNGFKYEKMKLHDGCSPFHFYSFRSFTLEYLKGRFLIEDPEIEMKTVAELEDVLEWTGNDKDIEL